MSCPHFCFFKFDWFGHCRFAYRRTQITPTTSPAQNTPQNTVSYNRTHSSQGHGSLSELVPSSPNLGSSSFKQPRLQPAPWREARTPDQQGQNGNSMLDAMATTVESQQRTIEKQSDTITDLSEENSKLREQILILTEVGVPRLLTCIEKVEEELTTVAASCNNDWALWKLSGNTKNDAWSITVMSGRLWTEENKIQRRKAHWAARQWVWRWGNWWSLSGKTQKQHRWEDSEGKRKREKRSE